MSTVSLDAARYRKFVQQALKVQDAAHDSDGGPPGALTITLGNVDLPAFVSDGQVYIQAPLPHVFRGFAADLPSFLRDMEIGVSNTRSAALSLASARRAVRGKRLAKPNVVPSGGKQ